MLVVMEGKDILINTTIPKIRFSFSTRNGEKLILLLYPAWDIRNVFCKGTLIYHYMSLLTVKACY